MTTYNGREYGYVYNLQGDVVGLTDVADGFAEVVAYVYDAWGKPVSVTGPLANTLGRENPFRYRGYVYDEETGLYALPARYYNPEWGRFINADAMVTRNLFAYCSNNPVMKLDRTGYYEEDMPTNTFNLDAAIRSQKLIKAYHVNASDLGGVTREQYYAMVLLTVDPAQYEYSLRYSDFVGEDAEHQHIGEEKPAYGCSHYKFGIYPGNETIHVCCGYLQVGVFGGFTYVNGRKDARIGEIISITSVSDIQPGMEIFQTDKHVGRAFSVGGSLFVFHSSVNGGPVIQPLNEIGAWTEGIYPSGIGGYAAFFFVPKDKFYLGI